MITQLRQKLHALIYDEEGVALVVTLAIFMLLYVSCAGVFAIGRAVKGRVLLQNAADAAAYSAAVVQADVLSRISAINRAMAWTYKDMILRQHDYILLTWLEKAYEQYKSDKETKYQVYGDSAGGSDRCLLINDTIVSDAEVENVLKKLPDIKARIGVDSEQIKEMENKEKELLSEFIGSSSSEETGIAKATVRRILEANISGEFGKQCLRKIVLRGGWWENGTDEGDFLNFDPGVGLVDDEDDENWFPVSDEEICRYYLASEDKNVAQWWYRVLPMSPVVPQSPVYSRDVQESSRPLVSLNSPNGLYTARPQILKKSYFPANGGEGAISVCVAQRTDNSWKFGKIVLDGIYDTFKPFSEHTRWARAISSAQAGYRDGTKEGTYSVRWKDDGYWNLGTNDWDAVHVPVGKVFTSDTFGNLISPIGWDKVLDTGHDELVKRYEEGCNTPTYLPSMHNNANSDKQLKWKDEQFLKLMFH